MTGYRVKYAIRLTGSVDFDAPDMPAASDAARDWLKRQYGHELTSVTIEQVVERTDPRST